MHSTFRNMLVTETAWLHLKHFYSNFETQFKVTQLHSSQMSKRFEKHSHCSLFQRQTIDATNHLLHVSCRGLHAAPQPIVLGDNLRVLLQPETCETTEMPIHYICTTVTIATECKWFGGLLECEDQNEQRAHRQTHINTYHLSDDVWCFSIYRCLSPLGVCLSSV